jgi:hypothetical protein
MMPGSTPTLPAIEQTLAADGYTLEVSRHDAAAVTCRITAGPDACQECLAPKPIMARLIADALSLPADSVTLVYPSD